MTDLPPPMPPDSSINYQSAGMVDRDQEHLKILGIFWYIVSGIAALGGFFPLIYLFFGVMAYTGAMHPPGSPPAAAGSDQLAGIMLMFMGGCFSLFIWVGAVMGFFTARSLGQRRRIVLCYITAGMSCLSIPFGTVLGIFTFLVLLRPSVKATFT